MTTVVLPVNPIGKPRQSRKDAWDPSPAVLRYRAYADELRLRASLLHFTMPMAGAAITFHLRMSESWSKQKKLSMAGQPHTFKPDIDNLLKAMLDALLPDGDEGVHHLAGLRKVWSHDGGIVVEF